MAAIHTEHKVAAGELPAELNDLEVTDETSTDDDVAEVAERPLEVSRVTCDNLLRFIVHLKT